MATKALCSICSLRPVPSLKVRQDAGMSSDMDFCIPCFDEAGWENSHSDHAHEEIAKDLAEIEAGAKIARLKEIAKSYSIKLDRTQRTIPTITAAILGSLSEFVQESKECWICRPELNKAKAEYAAREAGTSRKGQVIHAKGSVGDKVAVVTTAIEAKGLTATVKTSKGHTVLTAEFAGSVLRIEWDAKGRYQYGPSVFGKNKIRNVSEALRVIAAKA